MCGPASQILLKRVVFLFQTVFVLVLNTLEFLSRKIFCREECVMSLQSQK